MVEGAVLCWAFWKWWFFVVVLVGAADLIGLHISACEWQKLSCVIHTFLVLEKWNDTICIHFH
jgi:hypothetical protein